MAGSILEEEEEEEHSVAYVISIAGTRPSN